MKVLKRVYYLQESHGDGHGDASGPQGPFASGHRPRVTLQLTQQVGEVHVAAGHGLDEPGYKVAFTEQLLNRDFFVLLKGSIVFQS